MYHSSLPRSASGRLLVALGPPIISLVTSARPVYAAGVWPLHTSASRETPAPGVGRPQRVAGLPFRSLTLVTVFSIFSLVALGGAVRLTESGLGCPDWPLCHGKVIPPLDTPTLIEYSHRLVASLAGLLVLATALVVWGRYRSRPWLMVSATAGFLLLVLQVLLGGLTVLSELPPGIVLAHLATAEALMAAMIVVCMSALRNPSPSGYREEGEAGRGRFPLLMLGVLLGAYALLLTGSYVTVSGATTSCGQWWPLCQGQVIPEGQYAMIHMVHRVVALLVGALIVAVLVHTWRRRNERPALGWAAALVGGLFLAQVLIGASVLWMGFPISARLLHLVMATAVWVGLAALTFLSYTSYTAPKPDLREASRA